MHNSSANNHSTRGVLMLTLCAFIWGTAFIAQSVGGNYAEPLTFNCARSVLATIFLFGCCLLFDKAAGKRFTVLGSDDPIYKERLLKGGISQVISNSVSEAFSNAFSIPPLVTTIALTALAAVIVLRKDATVKSLDVIVPIMAGCYFLMTLYVVFTNLPQLPGVLARIFSEAFGLRQAAAGGFGAVVMNGVKRGLFSNEAGSGSAPCAAAAAECDDPVKMGLVQALGVLIDTIVICSCTAFVMLLAPESVTAGLQGMNLLQAAMQYHLGGFGVVFIAVTLALFSFSTFIGILFYARCNVAYLFGDHWGWQTAYKLLALAMMLVGGVAAYTVVWDLGDVGIGLMTIFNMIALYPLSGEALTALQEYEKKKHLK